MKKPGAAHGQNWLITVIRIGVCRSSLESGGCLACAQFRRFIAAVVCSHFRVTDCRVKGSCVNNPLIIIVNGSASTSSVFGKIPSRR